MDKEIKLKILEEIQFWTDKNELLTSSEMDVELAERISNRFEAFVSQSDSQPMLRVEKTIESLIKAANKRFEDANKYNNYSSMATLDAYKNGLGQALEVIKLR